MLDIVLNRHTHTNCTGFSRRDFLRVGALAGISLPALLRAEAVAANKSAKLLEFIGQEIVDGTDQPAYQRWVRQLMTPQLTAIGRAKQPNDTEATQKIRARVLARLALVGHEAETIAQLKQLADQYLQEPEAVDPSLVDAAIETATMYGDAAFQNRMLAALENQAGCLAHLERELGRDHAIGAAANAVGAEILASHKSPASDAFAVVAGTEPGSTPHI